MRSVTVRIMLVCLVVFVLQMLPGIGPQIQQWCILVPSKVFVHGEAWRLMTFVFMHGGILHIIFNMLTLWYFGSAMESHWGSLKYLWFYMVCGVGSGLLCFPLWNLPILGASGAIMGLLTAYAWYFPRRTIVVWFFPLPAWLAVTMMGLISLALSGGTAGGIAHVAHLGGIIVALGWLLYERYVPWNLFKSGRTAANRYELIRKVKWQ